MLGERYHLREPLGSGGTSDVYRGYDEVLDRAVAVKLLSDTVPEASRPRLRAEARIAASLNHPWIAQVYDYGEAEDTPFLVMELVDGRPLSDLLIAEGRLPWLRATAMCAQLADAGRSAPARPGAPRHQAGERADHRPWRKAGRLRHLRVGRRCHGHGTGNGDDNSQD